MKKIDLKSIRTKFFFYSLTPFSLWRMLIVVFFILLMAVGGGSGYIYLYVKEKSAPKEYLAKTVLAVTTEEVTMAAGVLEEMEKTYRALLVDKSGGFDQTP